MKNAILWSLIIIIFVAGAGGTYYFYAKYQKAQSQYQSAKFSLDNPQIVAETEIKEITGKLGKLMLLPADENPTVATVLDKDKVKDQLFFKSSENGDKVVIYAKAMKAILYRPTDNKIIEVAPISIASPQTDSTAFTKKLSPTPTETVTD